MERGEGTLGEDKDKDQEILPNEEDGEEEVGQSKVEKDVCKEKEDEGCKKKQVASQQLWKVRMKCSNQVSS